MFYPYTYISVFNPNKPWTILLLWMSFKKLYLHTTNQCGKCTQYKGLLTLIYSRTLKGSNLQPLAHSSQLLVLTALFFSWSSQEAGSVHLTCQTGQTLTWVGPWAVSLILQVLTIWTNPASQTQLFVSFLLCLLEFPSVKCCGARTQEFPAFLHVLQQPLDKHKAWSFSWAESAKSGCKDSIQSKERCPGMLVDHWVTGSLMSVVMSGCWLHEGRGHFCLVHWHIS